MDEELGLVLGLEARLLPRLLRPQQLAYTTREKNAISLHSVHDAITIETGQHNIRTFLSL